VVPHGLKTQDYCFIASRKTMKIGVQAKLRNEPDNLLVLTTTRTDNRHGHSSTMGPETEQEIHT
jgi:hypothetical protein